MKPFGIIYLTSRVFQGEVVRKYVGQHQVKNGVIEDGYLGSGNLLMAAFKKYGKKSFIREVLEVCYSQDEMNEAEIRWIEKLDCVKNPLYYNIGAGGELPPLTETRIVHQYDLEGNYVKKFPSLISAQRELGFPYTSLYRVCKGVTNTCGGSQWRYEKVDKIPPARVGLHRPVIQYDTDGNFVSEFSSVVEASKITGIGRGGISQVLRKACLSAGGFMWRYAEDKSPVKPIRPKIKPVKAVIKVDPITGEDIKRFPSMTEASMFVKGSIGNLSLAVNKGHLAYGFLWKLEGDNSDARIRRRTVGNRKGKVVCFDDDSRFIAEFETMRKAAQFYGLDGRRISDVCRDKITHCGDMRWCYADDYELKGVLGYK